MDNPFLPPNARLEDPISESDEFTKPDPRKAGLRPRGLIAVVGLFAAFKVLEIWILAATEDEFWPVTVALVTILIFVLRGLWWGHDKSRKRAVWYSAFMGLLLLVGGLNDGAQSVLGIVDVADGFFLMGAALYFFKLKANPFFADAGAP